MPAQSHYLSSFDRGAEDAAGGPWGSLPETSSSYITFEIKHTSVLDTYCIIKADKIL